jgi:histidine triad (HIT) family protein
LAEDSCIFCRIAAGEIDSEVVERTDDMVAFRDIDPKAPTHILVIPREHVASLNDMKDDPALPGRMLLLARELAQREGIARSGYRIVLNTGGHGGQSVEHVHLHLLGGRSLGWPPG